MSSTPSNSDPSVEEKQPESVLQKRFRRFRSLKRGWYSFLILSTLYVLSFGTSLVINEKALCVKYEGSYYFPAFSGFYDAKTFGQRRIGAANYRILKDEMAAADEGNWVLLPFYPYGTSENFLRELEGEPPHAPSAEHWLGTDLAGRDVFARLVHGFWYSLTFAIGVVLLSYTLGVLVGAIFGFFGGRIDIYGQRLVEVWAGLPFLYTVMIVASIVTPNIVWLTALVALFSWMGITYYIRGEFYREKAKDYVSAAIAIGESRRSIMLRHILPNALTPIISFAPFALVGAISAIVSLDFLGFGLPVPTPSWGELMDQGLQTLRSGDYHLILSPLLALFSTLLMVVFIGEAVREAFDPKVFSRLR